METGITHDLEKKWARRALWLVELTITYNIAEACFSLWIGAKASSIALTGFGVDSLIEISAAVLLLWRLIHEVTAIDERKLEERENLVRKLVGYTFIALSAYIIVESCFDLLYHNPPQTTLPGIVITLLSAIIMPALALGKIRAAKEIQSESLRLEAKESIACSVLSVIVLLGLSANAAFGWWWADPVGALLMLPWLLREGFEGIRGESCCCHE